MERRWLRENIMERQKQGTVHLFSLSIQDLEGVEGNQQVVIPALIKGSSRSYNVQNVQNDESLHESTEDL